MAGIPSPEDIAVDLLEWVSAPAVVVIVFTSVLAVLGWVSFGRSSVRYASAAGVRAREMVRYWTTERQRALFTLVGASTGFLAFAYSLAQLAEVTYEKVGHNTSIAYGMTFDANYLMSRLLQYRHWTPLSEWAVVICVGSIVALNLANLAGIVPLRKLLTFLWSVVLGLGALGGCLIGISGICVLLLGLTHSDNYQPSMAILYALWVACLWALPWLAGIIRDTSQRVFQDQPGR